MKLDLRTALVVLGAIAVGYMICLAMPMAQADANDPGWFAIEKDVVVRTDRGVWKDVYCESVWAHYIKTSSGDVVIDLSGNVQSTVYIAIKGGIDIPDPLPGYAQLYVDKGSGDFFIQFSNGITKLITED